MSCVRQLTAERSLGPLPLDLFKPCEPQARFTAIVTNQRGRAKSILAFHHGRRSQEGLFAEAKSHVQMGSTPVRSLQCNRLFHHAALLAHHLTKELQMQTQPPDRATCAARPAPWRFPCLHTFRSRFLLRAARLTRPQNRPTLTMNASDAIQTAIERMLRCLGLNPV